jgi:ribonuclease HII
MLYLLIFAIIGSVIGIDEVGRGSLAGPLLVVAARQVNELPPGVADSKVLSKKVRESLFNDIYIACDIGEGWVTALEINSLGLTKAMRLAVKRALSQLQAAADEEIIMDGNINYCAKKFINARPIINADADYPTVSAASIYAKVLRDRYMTTIAKDYPHYSFEKHVGYGTKLHREMIKLHGTCELHRIAWRPFQEQPSV